MMNTRETLQTLLTDQLDLTDGLSLSEDLISVLKAAITNPDAGWSDEKKLNLVFQVEKLSEFLVKLDKHRDLIYNGMAFNEPMNSKAA